MLPVNIDKKGFRGWAFKLGKLYHTGYDFNCGLGAIVLSVAPGTVLFSSQIVTGFGGYPNIPGGVLIIRHYDKKGSTFIGFYGHVESDMIEDENVIRGQKLGHVHQYISAGLELPHLHYGINEFNAIPESPWGYVSNLAKYGWVDPIKFHKNNL